MAQKVNPVRETDEEAIALAAKLVLDSRYAALGVCEIETNIPLVSRVATAWSEATGLFFAASDLSIHSKCLLENQSCSLLLGEPGKGDGLAHPRVTMVGTAARMINSSSDRQSYRDVFIKNHPKAELYIDFADFGFYPLNIDRALLNGGFGKAYHLSRDDLTFLYS